MMRNGDMHRAMLRFYLNEACGERCALGLDAEKQVMAGSTAVDEVLIEKARRTVALREEMSLDERYEVMEMLGLVGDGATDLVRTVDIQVWNSTHGRM